MRREFIVTIQGKRNSVTVIEQQGATFLLEINGKQSTATVTPAYAAQSSIHQSHSVTQSFVTESKVSSSPDIIVAPFAGIVSQLKAKVGDTVSAGTELLIIEAMKMENSIKSRLDGTISECCVEIGTEVKKGQPLFRIK